MHKYMCNVNYKHRKQVNDKYTKVVVEEAGSMTLLKPNLRDDFEWQLGMCASGRRRLGRWPGNDFKSVPLQRWRRLGNDFESVRLQKWGQMRRKSGQGWVSRSLSGKHSNRHRHNQQTLTMTGWNLNTSTLTDEYTCNSIHLCASLLNHRDGLLSDGLTKIILHKPWPII